MHEVAAEEIGRGDRADAHTVRTSATGSNRTPVPRPDGEWVVTDRCPECGGPTLIVRRVTERTTDYAEQTTHRKGCSLAN